MSENVTPDEFGRLRVTDKDTGHRRSIGVSELPHGNYTVLKQDASDPTTGEALPPEFPDAAPASVPATKEKTNG